MTLTLAIAATKLTTTLVVDAYWAGQQIPPSSPFRVLSYIPEFSGSLKNGLFWLFLNWDGYLKDDAL